ncbi:GntR family transcriptional regulator [Paracoccus xiamenensis]|uniref:GntR family transcriptional regulator n=1 Tax=Paracoccus xiamenensis TaxID=2714901 RepID=UPI00140A9156|nr:GntR family transcriptional regulator [Paracoccus xiamenensis]NHF74459.1 GntR family transcriptional regulator [Paracoccus xiamenensis]
MPQYLTIAADLEARISSGQIREGERLKSERDLAEATGVSRMTARRAIQELVAKGVVEARGGSGHYVRRAQIQQRLTSLTSFTEEIESQGRTSSSLVVLSETEAADEEVRAALGLAEAAQVHRLVRVRLADAEPVALETTFLNAAMMPGLIDQIDFAQTSLYRHIRDAYGIVPTKAEQSLKATLADRKTATLLKISVGDPILNIRRLTRDGNGNAFEFVRSSYRADLFEIKAELNLNPEPKP